MDYIEKNLENKIGVGIIFHKNPNLTQEFIEKHIDEKWDWYYISKNLVLTEEFIKIFRN